MSTNFPPDFDEELEGDTLWEALEHSTLLNPSPTFVQDTLRCARLESEKSRSCWQNLLNPQALIGTSVAACAAIAILSSLKSTTPDMNPISKTAADASLEGGWGELEDTLASELLVGATEDPSLLSDEEIIALLF